MAARRDTLVRNRAKSGALGGIRTPDTWFRRPVLYPLSYERVRKCYLIEGYRRLSGAAKLNHEQAPALSECPF